MRPPFSIHRVIKHIYAKEQKKYKKREKRLTRMNSQQ